MDCVEYIYGTSKQPQTQLNETYISSLSYVNLWSALLVFKDFFSTILVLLHKSVHNGIRLRNHDPALKENGNNQICHKKLGRERETEYDLAPISTSKILENRKDDDVQLIAVTERYCYFLVSFIIRLLTHLGVACVQYWVGAECANSDNSAILPSRSKRSARNSSVRHFIKFLHLSLYLVITCLSPTIDIPLSLESF